MQVTHLSSPRAGHGAVTYKHEGFAIASDIFTPKKAAVQMIADKSRCSREYRMLVKIINLPPKP